MNSIKTFSEFNENLLSGLGSSIKNLGKTLKKTFRFEDEGKTEYKKELNQYELSLKKSEDEQSLNIFHKKRLVADITLSDERTTYPIWVLKIYFYQSETPSDKKYKTPESIPNQSEQPYAVGKKKFPADSDDAVRAFWKWWSTQTKSGRSKNPVYKVKS